jgi:hypothetical protein
MRYTWDKARGEWVPKPEKQHFVPLPFGDPAAPLYAHGPLIRNTVFMDGTSYAEVRTDEGNWLPDWSDAYEGVVASQRERRRRIR